MSEDDDERQEMNEEDKKLQDDLHMMIERLEGKDPALYLLFLQMLTDLIQDSSTLMISISKPFQLMRPHYGRMKIIYEKMTDDKDKRVCACLISVLAMCFDEKSDCLNFRLKAVDEAIEAWGYEYIRHLTMEIGNEWKSSVDERKNQMMELVKKIVTCNLKRNSEREACDLLLVIEQLDVLLDLIDKDSHERVCLYLLRSAPSTPDPDNQLLIRCAMEIYSKFGFEFEALRCAVMLNDVDLIKEKFVSKDLSVWKQMAILLSRHHLIIDFDGPDAIADILRNLHLSKIFSDSIKTIGTKNAEGICEKFLETRVYETVVKPENAHIDCAAVIINAVVNCGIKIDNIYEGNGKFLTSKFSEKFLEASLGFIHHWHFEEFFRKFDFEAEDNESENDEKEEESRIAGSILAYCSSAVEIPEYSPMDMYLCKISSDTPSTVRLASIFGFGLVYSNSRQKDNGLVFELKKVLNDSNENAEVKGMTGLSLGLILIGTADESTANDLLKILQKCQENDFINRNWSLIGIGIGLIFLGTQQKSKIMVESLKALSGNFGRMFAILVDCCAYAGTGNDLKVQDLLHIYSQEIEQEECLEPPKKKYKEDKENHKDLASHQDVAVLGMGLLAMRKGVGSLMYHQTLENLMNCGKPIIRRAVPLALALLSISNPQLTIIETLSKYFYDSDAETARNAIFALGLVGAGTCDENIIRILGELEKNYTSDCTSLIKVGLAQGLTHLGKGTMTLNPFYSDRQIMSLSSVGALLVTCFCFLDANILSSHQNYLIYCLSLAIQPRMLITLIEEKADFNNPGGLKQENVPVRVGQAVDVVIEAAYGERAELATDEYVPLTPYMEGLVILKKSTQA